MQQQILKQRYRILKKVGQGGMGVVYMAEDIQLGNRLVAVKEMDVFGLSPQEILEKTKDFKREAQILASLKHNNLPHIYDYFDVTGHWYLVMDFIEGETLEGYQSKARGKRLDVAEVLRIGTQLCTVLSFLHGSTPPIIFRDLKPANIMRTPDDLIYLIDFGIARHFKPGQTKDTAVLGSLGYAAPEQHGKAQTDHLSDIYSLGATLHELLSGDDPADHLFKFVPLSLSALYAPLGLLIARMVDTERTRRPQSMAEIKRELEQIAAQQHLGSQNQPGQPGGLGPYSLRQPLSPRPLGMTICSYTGHTEPVRCLTWSPDGRHIASGGKTVFIWDTSQGYLMKRFEDHARSIIKIFWLSNVFIASVGQDKTIRIWDINGKDKAKNLKSRSGHFTAAQISPDRHYIATSTGKDVQIWRSDLDLPIFVYQRHTDDVYALAWSPSSQRVASAGNDGTIQIWDAGTGLNILTCHGHEKEILGLQWSPDGRYLASRSSDRTVRVWDATSAALHFMDRALSSFLFSNNILTFAWSPDSRQIASASRDKTVQIWDISSKDKNIIYKGHLTPVQLIKWSPDGRRIASSAPGEDKTVQIWDATTGNRLYTYQNYAYQRNSTAVVDMAWSPDGMCIASTCGDKVVDVWQAK